jgi:hypothetical protein
MSTRLQDAITQLPPDKVEELADYAEFLLSRLSAQRTTTPQFLKLDWAGKAADAYPERSGVEAAHAAADLIRKSVERGLSM